MTTTVRKEWLLRLTLSASKRIDSFVRFTFSRKLGGMLGVSDRFVEIQFVITLYSLSDMTPCSNPI
uniref:Uncharacterized protein n=1 Tax=Arundo donax TaxID=35708 RepID=A0A0A9CZQ1_ARUDO